MNLASLIEESVRKFSEKIFIIEHGLYRRKEFTYKEIYEMSQSLKSHLEKNKVTKGDKIIIYLPNSSDYAAILMTCSLSGVIAVPIDINNNIEFVEKIYKTVQAKAVFCSIFKQPSYGKKIYSEELSNIYKEKFKEEKSKVRDADIF